MPSGKKIQLEKQVWEGHCKETNEERKNQMSFVKTGDTKSEEGLRWFLGFDRGKHSRGVLTWTVTGLQEILHKSLTTKKTLIL